MWREASYKLHKPETKESVFIKLVCAPCAKSEASVNNNSFGDSGSQATLQYLVVRLVQKYFKARYAQLDNRTATEWFQDEIEFKES